MLVYVSFLMGLVVLIWSADKFVDGAAATAKNLGMSPLLIGLTIVALGTSAPEIVVSIIAALEGAPTLAVGNAIGSNIANIGLVLGVTCLLVAMPVDKSLLTKEVPVLVIVTLIAGYCVLDNQITWHDSLILITSLIVILVLLGISTNNSDDEEEELDEDDMTLGQGVLWLLVGLVLLLVSSRVLVWSATEIAMLFGISELVIGLTVIALGTSLPELAASVASALKGLHDIAIGNIIGSNILNILAVMSIPGLFEPTNLETLVFFRDYLVMFGLTSMLVIGLIIWRQKGELPRAIGVGFLGIYIGYYVLLYYTVPNVAA